VAYIEFGLLAQPASAVNDRITITENSPTSLSVTLNRSFGEQTARESGSKEPLSRACQFAGVRAPKGHSKEKTPP